jgi:hypothetical protein
LRLSPASPVANRQQFHRNEKGSALGATAVPFSVIVTASGDIGYLIVPVLKITYGVLARYENSLLYLILTPVTSSGF